MFVRALAPLICILLLTLACQTKEADTVVARFASETVTLSELDAWIKDKLFERKTSGGNPSKIFDLREKSLRELVSERIFAAEAARRDISTEQLIEEEIEALGEVSDEEIAAFYEEKIDQMGEQTLEQATPRIRDYLLRTRAQAVGQRLFEAADVDFLLEPTRVDVAADGPAKGPENAAVTIVEFSDFQCPYCSRVLPVLEEVMARYPDDVRIVYRHLPLDRIHARARPAAEASLCAQDQGQFWAYHDLIFANAKTLSDKDLKRFAEEAGLDVAAWEQCVADGKFAAKVDADVAAGRAVGITSTPAFVINGVVLSGAKPIETFVMLIEAEIQRSAAADNS